MRSIVVFAALALAAGVLVPPYAARFGTRSAEPPSGPERAALAARPPAADDVAAVEGSRSVVVSPDGRGHFQVDARVDGQRLSFMVDTGASVVALSSRDAAMLGIYPAPSAFTVEVRTANGTVRAAPTLLDAVEVGDLVVHNVAALVLPDQTLSDNLLGLSFLSRLRRFEYSEGRLVLEQ